MRPTSAAGIRSCENPTASLVGMGADEPLPARLAHGDGGQQLPHYGRRGEVVGEPETLGAEGVVVFGPAPGRRGLSPATPTTPTVERGSGLHRLPGGPLGILAGSEQGARVGVD